MSSIQYTIRSIPKPIDTALRKDAQMSGKSLNQVIIDALGKATGTSASQQRFSDLDALIGKGISDKKAFDETVAWMDTLPIEVDLDI